MSSSFRLAHLSDTHIGLSQYPVASPVSGRNQREVDILRAFVGVVEDIERYDPDLVIHSGDVAEKPTVTYRQQRQIQDLCARMTRRPDGTKRLLVVISGNHDMSRDPREACHLTPALDPLPAVACVTNQYRQVAADRYIDAGQAGEKLRDVIVHCLPHDQLKNADWDAVTPVEGKVNILTSHGVVGGSELYKRSCGREYSIPIEVLLRKWDYVALGHFHKPGPVSVGGIREEDSYIWYAGSPENCGFSDLRDGVGGRGYLQVDINTGAKPEVTKVELPIRAMFRLPVLDAEGLDAEQITTRLKDIAKAADVKNAVVDQRIIGVHRDTWSLVDATAVRRAASAAMWYQMTPVFTRGHADGSEDAVEQLEQLGDLERILTLSAEDLMTDEKERSSVMELARNLLGSALTAGPGADDDTEAKKDAKKAPASEEAAAAIPARASDDVTNGMEGAPGTVNGMETKTC